jgi:hypothetical protein
LPDASKDKNDLCNEQNKDWPFLETLLTKRYLGHMAGKKFWIFEAGEVPTQGDTML